MSKLIVTIKNYTIIQLNPNKKINFVENTQLNVLIQGVKSVGVRIGGQ